MAEEKQYIVIDNWDKYQHYGKRIPPWIKLHTSVIEPINADGKPNPFYHLSDAAKLALMLIWVRASRTFGIILMQSRHHLEAEVGIKNGIPLDELIKSRLIRVCSKPYRIKNKSASAGFQSNASGFASTDKNKNKRRKELVVPCPVVAAPEPLEADRRKRQPTSTPEEYSAWFNAEIEKHFPASVIFALGPAYPHIDIESDIAKATAWALARPPSERKRAVKKFVISWLARSESKAASRMPPPSVIDDEPPMRTLTEAEKQAILEKSERTRRTAA